VIDLVNAVSSDEMTGDVVNARMQHQVRREH
jgi:hypothetical protein